MKTTTTLLALMLAVGSQPARADSAADAAAAFKDIEATLGFVPQFLRAMPTDALPGIWEEMKELQLSSNTALPVKVKELIGLAVAAQIPCRYCVLAHTELAKANGATRDELGTAVAEAGLTRHWSAVIDGTQVDPARFRRELAVMINQLKATDPTAPQPATAPVDDPHDAFEEADRAWGVVPGYMLSFPVDGFLGAWKTLRGVEHNPNSTLSAKHLRLIGLAVASQIPSQLSIVANTELARLEGASQVELNEAVAVAGFTRQMSALLSGLQVNEARFKADVARLAKPRGKLALR